MFHKMNSPCIQHPKQETLISQPSGYHSLARVPSPLLSKDPEESSLCTLWLYLILHFVGSYRYCMCWSFSCVRLFVTPGTEAHQALLSLGFSRQEYHSGLPFPSPEDLLNPDIEPAFPALRVDSSRLRHQGSPLSPQNGSNSRILSLCHMQPPNP